MERGTSTEHVQAVLAIKDRVLRNYWVTQSYSDLAAGLTALLQPGTANWCTFAVWASCTVGRNLRGEDLPDWLHDRVVGSDGMMGAVKEANGNLKQSRIDRWVHAVDPDRLGLLVRDLFGACATNLSDGNTVVFSEIAPPAAIFIAGFSADPSTARDKVLEACDGAPEFEGVNRLRAGFTHWCDAMTEDDTTRRSQLILAGSLELGAHEQNHLQGPIEGSMDMGVNQSVTALKRRLADSAPFPAELEEAFDDALRPVATLVGGLWGDLMTELLGTIVTPDGTLRLNHDVPPIQGQPFVPPDLEPVVVSDLTALLERFDRADELGHDSRALDWSVLDQRMNFITNLFRSRHHRQELFAPPFEAATMADIEADRLPGLVPPGAPRVDDRLRPAPVVPPSKGVQRFTEEYVATLRQTGDSEADAAVAEFFEATQAKHSELFSRLATRSAKELADEELPGIGPFVRHQAPWPPWANAELVAEGQRVFGEFGPQMGMGLFMASLPSDYGFAYGVQALGRTARLTRNPKRRYVETGQMIINAMTPGALEPGGIGYDTVRHVRLMHAAVRHVLLHADEVEQYGASPIEKWDSAYGVPISQFELLGTMFSFGVQGVESLGRLGVRLDNDRAEAYIHVWNLVGHQIGILDDLLPLSWLDSKALWDDLRRREWGPSAEGHELTAAAIECMRELFGLTFMPGLPATGIRHFLGDQAADMLGVPKADWTRAVFEAITFSDRAYNSTLPRLPGLPSFAAVLGRRIWRGFELYGRDGQRPGFEVTAELKQAWGMRT